MKRLAEQQVTVDVVGKSWEVEYFDPVTGKFTGKSQVTARDRRVQISLPAFEGSVALKLKRLDMRKECSRILLLVARFIS